jgi:F-type H+-transporting ATPase subunit b
MDLLTPSLGLIFWTTVIFLIFLFLITKMAWKPILKSLDDREKTIDDSLKTADRIKQEMASMQSQHQDLLKEAKQEKSNIIKEAKEAKEAIISEARDKAKQEYAKIIEDAKLEITNQKTAAIAEVKANAGKMIVESSEKILRRQLSSKGEQENYISELVNKANLN